jgi:hypothetical protein
MTDPSNEIKPQDKGRDDRYTVILGLVARQTGGATLYDMLEALPQWDRETLRLDCDALVLAGRLVRIGQGRLSQYVIGSVRPGR